MKKIISIFLVFLMIFNIMGYFFAYLAALHDVKEEMKAELRNIENMEDADRFVIMVFPYNEGRIPDKGLEIVNEEEICYMGDMYDVAKSEVKDGKIYFYCINDSKEDSLNKAVIKHIEKNLTDNGTPGKKSNTGAKKPPKKFVLLQDIIPAIEYTLQSYCSPERYYSANHTTETLTPPPKVI